MAISYSTYTITEVQEGSQIWTSSVAPTTPNYTFTISDLVGDSDTSIKVGDIILNSYYRYTVLSIANDGTTVLTGNRVSIRGATGAASVTYSLIVSNLAIIKDKNGDISPVAITLTAKSQTGSNAMANYSGRFKIETTTDNSAWTTQYTSSANEATKTWSVIDDIVAIRCSLYLAGGTTTLLDQQTIPIVSDGLDGTNITITSTSVTYQKGTSGTTKPTGTWGTSIPSVGQGEYLWTKTVVTYSDSSSTESYSVSRNAVNGTNGVSPTVASTVTEYVQSDIGTTTPTSGWNTTPPTATAGKYMWTKVTVTYSDNATAISYSVSKNGTNGTNGINTATVYLYKRGTTTPSVPSGNTTYTFSTKQLTGTLDNWSQTIPTTGDGECYVIAAVASSNGTTDTIGTGEWSTPIQFNGTNGTNGTDGTNGLNQATIFLYKRGTSVTKPTTSITYTFSTGALSAEPNSWKRNIPTIDGNPCWVVTATAIGNGTTATITGSNWSDPVKLVEDGEDGKDAYTVILTNENHTFAGNTTSAIASEIECNVIAYKGATQVVSTIGTITGQPTGMTTTILNNGTVNTAFRVSVTTSMVTKNGILNVPVTVDGKAFTKKFTYALTLDGEKGDKGDTAQWYYGESLTHTSGTATLPISQTDDVTVGAMYLNTKTGSCYKCTAISGSNATWTYAGNITDSIDIDRRNLIWNTASPNIISWNNSKQLYGWAVQSGGNGTGSIETILDSPIGGLNKTFRISNNTSGNKDFAQVVMPELNTNFDMPHTFSAYVRGVGDNATALIRSWNNTKSKAAFSQSIAVTTEWQKVEVVFQSFTNSVAGDSLDVRFGLTGVGSIEYIAPKFELGEKATGWTPAPEDIEAEVSNLRTDLQSQIDEKIQTYYQATAPSWSSATDRAKHNGDLWYCTESDPYTGYEAKSVYRYDSVNNTWVEYSATSELFDEVDGKSTIYYGTTSDTFENVEDGDYLVDATDGSTYRYYNNEWLTVTDYQTAINKIAIGGRNLWINTLIPDVSSPDNYPRMVGQTDYTRVPSTANVDAAVAEHGIKAIVKTANKRPRFDFGYINDTNGFENGQTYTVSFDWSAKIFSSDTSTTTRFLGFYIYDNHTGSLAINEACTYRFLTITEELKGVEQSGRVEFTFTTDESATVIRISIMGNADTGQAIGDYFELRNMKLEKGNKATDWTPAPEDINAEISTKADSTDAVFEEQLIYISKASGTLSVDGTTTWITENGDVQNTWSTKRPTYNTDYPVLFIAKQRKTVSGTVTCTTPTKDDTTTVIDGGHITTGTIDASVVNVTNINASNIINTSAISIGGLSDSQLLFENLSPYFTYTPYVANDYWNYWQNTPAITFTEVGDGWVRVQGSNTGTTTIRRDFYPKPNLRIKEGTDYTWLIEFRNNHSTGTATQTDFYIVQTTNCQFWGSTIKENIEGAGTSSNTNIINYVPLNTSTVYKKRFVKTSEATGSSNWTNGSASNLRGLVSFTARCSANATIDYEVRVSVYEGRYLGEYKPYADSLNGWSVLINISAIDYLANTATLHATVYKDGIVQTNGFTLQWYKTYTNTSVTPQETTTTLISGETTSTLSVDDLNASYTCIVN